MDGVIHAVVNAISSAVFFVLSTFGIHSGAEQPKYDVLETVGNSVEIRRYQARIVAETTVMDKASDSRGEAFRLLAGYIFGANKTKKSIEMTTPVEIKTPGQTIAMTAPVEINKTEAGLVMRFFMPAEYTIDELPKPVDARVRLAEVPPQTMAVLRFSGSTSEAAVSKKAAELLGTLNGTSWKIDGMPTAFFYNPPWTIPLLRRNEVAVAVSK
jgi:SOUL heme-binding protein